MRKVDLFENFWKVYHDKSLQERQDYFNSLSKKDQSKLLKSLYKNGWYDLFIRNYVDDVVEYIKNNLKIDLLDMRIKAIKFKRIFLVDKVVWDAIELIMSEIDEYYDTNIFIGGLKVSAWGRKKQFYKIRSK